MSNPIAFQIAKASELSIVNAVKELCVECKLTISSWNVRVLYDSQTITSTDLSCEDNSEMLAIIEQNSQLASHITFALQNHSAGISGLHLQIIRAKDQPFDHLQATFNLTDISKRPEIYRPLASIRKHLHAIDSAEWIKGSLSGEMRNFYAARESELTKLESIATTIIVEQESYRQTLEASYQKRIELLENTYSKRLEEHEAKERALENRRKEVDDRQSKHVRRELRHNLKDEIKRRGQVFQLSKGTRYLRYHVNAVAYVLMCLFGAFFFWSIGNSLVSATPPADPFALYLKQIALGLAFGSTTIFYIRWHKAWFDKHAREEFDLKRLEIDIDRASWAAELASEWLDEDKEMPPELLNRLTANLFNTDHQPEPILHPADYLASAILGASAKANLKLPGGTELTLDRKSLKSLREDKGIAFE